MGTTSVLFCSVCLAHMHVCQWHFVQCIYEWWVGERRREGKGERNRGSDRGERA